MTLEWRKIRWGLFGDTWQAIGGQGISYEIDQDRHGRITLTTEYYGELISRIGPLPDVESAKAMTEFYTVDK
jgi:hypothetical protein